MENLTDLEAFIDHYYQLQANMNPDPENPNKRKKKDSSTDTEDLPTIDIEVSVLASINKKLDLLVTLHQEIKDIRESLDFAHHHIVTLQQSNQELQTTVDSLSIQMQTITNENKLMKDNILDLQVRSMGDNLIFSGIPEQTPDNPKCLIKQFMETHLKIPAETVQNITFHRVHRLGKHSDRGPRPIIAKFEHFEQKELVKSKGRELKGKPFGLNDQFPRTPQNTLPDLKRKQKQQ